MVSSIAVSSGTKSSVGLGVMLLAAATLAACSSNNAGGTGGVPAHLTVVTGAGLSGVVGTAVGPIVVRVTDADSAPVAGATVTFAVNGGASLSASSIQTDASGEALTSVTFSHVAEAVTVTATASGLSDGITFQETGLADAAVSMTLAGGNNQSAPRGSLLPDPMAVLVTDQFGNPVSGVTVGWGTNRGVLTSSSGRTNATGGSQMQLTTPPGAAGAITVTASATINGAVVMILFTENST
jgi:adhesin/invasin